ncbi:MAG: DUF4142 domain-containing protein [Flavobacterium circumlabens]|uniref:DUF4142 domain-containing protein n=1 Tax=Flavobacterium circumlabens TaxID=2133765 RepID=A0A4Y7UBA4_9FLAO|nr:DUF4142 domain-containing protein [Flavobacterium circumlabens]TCN57410.1 uncharacterized protein DUF4142 [Flavobacterium circumlabens]TEB43733.1 DUF4142 domain-containing protein [Flavobacterium circumlabens]
MEAKPIVKTKILRVLFLLIIIICSTSCKENNPIETSLKNEVFIKSDKEQSEAYFLIATANISKSIIAKSQIAQQESSESKIGEIGKRLQNQQNLLLQDVTRMANNRLVVVAGINTDNRGDLYEQIEKNDNNLNKAYVDAVATSLAEQIKLFESISRDTNDRMILKLVLQYLPESYQLLREVAQIREQIN